MSRLVYRSVNDLKGFSLKNCPSMPEPGRILMCPPDHYDVVDVKNPYMAGKVGTVNRNMARRQWEGLKEAFMAAGKSVVEIPSVAGLEDMVFCANQTMTGLTPKMERVCLLSSMRHPSRRREVGAFEAWFKAEGYRVQALKTKASFEGAGDAIWHPGKRLIWGGHGFRSEPEAYEEVVDVFEAPVILLKLVNERFYHLDTCFCPLTPESVLIYPSAFDAESLELILKIFPVVVTASEPEAVRQMACNAAVIDSTTAVIHRGSASVKRHMEALGLKVLEVDTSEFIKSGGSVYCLKMFLY
ncbi:MAG: arginine deiminase-related protein [Elusimicrobiota bacterium]